MDPSELDPDPLVQLGRWLAEAEQAGVPEPTAMALATATPDGVPSARMVLLKGLDGRGLVWFTNYNSAKAHDLAANPKAALVFRWEPLGRQVRATGEVSKVDDDESDAYFATRDRGSQLGAWASPQSEELGSRQQLEGMLEEVTNRFANQPVPRPPHWGGYRLSPTTIEFWQQGPDRLHDRVRYTRTDKPWRRARLAP
jgi:pyridoxamine 5'-phosphate oxidase